MKSVHSQTNAVMHLQRITSGWWRFGIEWVRFAVTFTEDNVLIINYIDHETRHGIFLSDFKKIMIQFFKNILNRGVIFGDRHRNRISGTLETQRQLELNDNKNNDTAHPHNFTY